MLDFGRYRRQTHIENTGGGLSVYLAEDGEREAKVYVARDLDRDVASFSRGISLLKQLPPELPIARVLDGGIGPSFFWVAVEHHSGPTWAELFARIKDSPGPLTMAEPLLDISRTLEVAHGARLIHGCFSPEAIIMRNDGSCIITGFGVTPLLQRTILRNDRYRAPEHYRQTMALDPRSDVYGLGVTLYQLMTLALPYSDQGAASTRSSVLSEPLCSSGVQMPECFQEIVVRATTKEPDGRFPRVADMRQALVEACQHLAVSVLKGIDSLECESGERPVSRTDPPAPDTLRSVQFFSSVSPIPPPASHVAPSPVGPPRDALTVVHPPPSPTASNSQEITPPARSDLMHAGMPMLEDLAHHPANHPQHPHQRLLAVALPSWIAVGLALVAVAALLVLTITRHEPIVVYVQPPLPSAQAPEPEISASAVKQAIHEEPSAIQVASAMVAPPLPPAPAPPHDGQSDESAAVTSTSCALMWYRCAKQ